MIASLVSMLTGTIVPPWARWAAIIALVLSAYGLGRVQEARHGADAMVAYVAQQAAHTVAIVKREVQVVTKVETRYRDRIQKIYLQGEQIENRIPEVLTPDVDRRLPLPAGFVRLLDAAWSGDPAGPAADSDGQPAGVPPSVVAANETGNATSCRAWREQALGWRAFYAGQQVAVNGKAGDWWQPDPPAAPQPAGQ